MVGSQHTIRKPQIVNEVVEVPLTLRFLENVFQQEKFCFLVFVVFITCVAFCVLTALEVAITPDIQLPTSSQSFVVRVAGDQALCRYSRQSPDNFPSLWLAVEQLAFLEVLPTEPVSFGKATGMPDDL